MNIKTNITHKYSYLTVIQITKRYFSYQLFVIGAVMTKACGGSSGEGGSSGGGGGSAILIDGGAPIVTAGIFDVFAQYTAGTPLVLTNEPGDDTYLIDYDQFMGSSDDIIDLQVSEVVGESGYDTVLVQGYSGAGFAPSFTGSNIILISPSGGSYPDIKFTFANDDFFERFVFDVDGDDDGLIDGSDFTWLVGSQNENHEIEGTDVKDYIYGGTGADTINGGVGNDEISGNEGDDTIDGGDGDDTIFYNKGDGNDIIDGGAGEDALILVGFVEDDVLSIERTGQDLKLNFKPTSQGGSITLKYSLNDDATGIDKIVFDTNADGIENATDIIWEDNNFERDIAASNIPYTNIIHGTDEGDILLGTAGNDIIFGYAGNDEISGNNGDDIIDGGAGDDTIWYRKGDIHDIKGDGHDIIDGGAGVDVLILSRFFVVEDILSFERTGNDLKLTFRDNVDGGSIILIDSFNSDEQGIDKIVLDTNSNGVEDTGDTIWEDHEFVSHLQTFINGGAPIATVLDRIDMIEEYNKNIGTRADFTNEPGDDTYLIDYTQVSDIDPQVSGSGTIDLQVNGVVGASGFDTVLVKGYSGEFFIPEFTGTNIITISPSGVSKPAIKFTFANDDIFERFVFDKNNNDLIDGSDFTWLIGKQNVNNLIEGTGVRDYIKGGVGNDNINGGGGDDTIYGGVGNDNINGGNGADTIYGGVGNDTIDGGWGNDIIYGGDGDNQIYGNEGNDYIYGGTGVDILSGGTEIDYIYGYAGNDILYGGSGDDTIYGGAGNDEISGGGGVDEIRYNKGDGDDTIYGGDTLGNDNDEDVLILVGFGVEDILSFERTGDDLNDLKLTFKPTAQGVDGGSIILKDSFNNNEQGIDKIVFDANLSGEDDTDTIWLDDASFANYLQTSIEGGAPIAVVSATTGTVLTGTSGDDTYLINYITGSDIIALRVNGVGGGYDTVIIQGYSGVYLHPEFPDTDVILISPSRGSYPDIKITFENDDIFERFVFDVDGNGLINGSDFTWLIGKLDVNNLIEGTNVKDYIYGYAGNDRLYGYDGEDILIGGAGNDYLYGGAGADTIDGNSGDDYIYGGGGIDNIYGGVGDDTIDGGDGNDDIRGDDGADTIEGGLGDDTIFGGEGNDTIDGGEGNDTIYGHEGDDTINGGVGNDTIYGHEGDDIIDGGTGDNSIFYNKGDGDDVIEVGDGVDTLILRGFVEDDILNLVRTDNDLKLNFKIGGSIILKDSFNNDATGIDKIVFDANDNGVKDAEETIWEDEDFESHLREIIDGGAPIATVDRIVVSVTTDTVLIDTPEDDTYLINYISGSGTIALQVNGVGGGYDTVIIQGYTETGFRPEDPDSDIVFTGSDVILISPSEGSYPAIKFTFTNLDIFERFVFDKNSDGQIDGSDFTWLIGSQNENSEIKGTDVTDYIYGGAGDDILHGNSGDDYIYGGGGIDQIEGGAGDDTIYGGDGDDYIYGGVGIDYIYGGAGDDYIEGNDGDDRIYGEVGDDTIHGGGGIDRINGGAGIDTIYGNAGNDDLSGGAGNDEIFGGAGIDTIYGGFGDDTIDGGDENDRIFGGDGDDTIDGGDGIDTIQGGKGADIIDGGAGNNTIVYNKGDGDDTISGGDGVDTLILVGFVEDDILNIVRTGQDLNDLKLTFKPTLQGVDGGSIILKDSFNVDEQGIDKIVFDTNSSATEDAGDIIWLDDDFESHLPYFINGGAPIATAGIDDVIAEYNDQDPPGTSLDLTDTSGDDTYLIKYIRDSGTIELQVIEGAGGASGYDTVIIQGYTDEFFYTSLPTGTNIIRISPSGGTFIKFTFTTLDIFERFVFDVDGDGLINGSDFTWLIGNLNINNLIEGTNVKDYIQAWDGNDIIYGNDGDDKIYGNAGDDTIYGGGGNDTIYGGDGNDYIDGGAWTDTIFGGTGNDYIYGGLGNDHIYGGAGDDSIFYNKGDGNDTILGEDGEDALILVGFVEDDVLSFERTGATGDDLKLTFKETALGEDGGSIILKYSFNDTDAGIDRIVFDTNENGQDSTDIIWEDEDFAGHLLTFIDGGAPIATVGRIDNVTAQYNLLNPAGTLQASLTPLILTNKLGVDDTYIIDYDQFEGNVGDTIELQVNGGAVGTSGFDTVIIQGYSGVGFRPEYPGTELDSILIEPLEESYPDIKFTFANDNIFERFVFDKNGDGQMDGDDDFVWLIGTRNVNYEIKGTDFKDYIQAWNGDDIISGGAGDDTIRGADGNDIIDGGAGDDFIGGSLGDDTLYGGDGADRIEGDFGNDIIYGGAGDDNIYGFWGDDEIYGGLGDDTIHGSFGADTIYGGAGDDDIDAGDENDTIFYNKGDGDDTIYGGDIQGNDNDEDVLILVGFDEDDVLSFVQTGQDLKLTFKESSGGGSIILKDSVNSDEQGIDRIVFDTNNDEIEDSTDIIWEDHEFVSHLQTFIEGDAPIADVSVTTDTDLIDTPEDDTYLINYISGSGTIALQVSGVGGGYDTVIIQGYSVEFFYPVITGSVILISPSGGTDIEFTFTTLDIFERFVFDTNNSGQVDGSDFTWLIGNRNINNLIEGTDVIDYIRGGAGADILYGYAGDDIIDGNAGDDTIYGGAGNDAISASDGNDILYGGAGIDYIFGHDGDDYIYGGTGNDFLYGHEGNDTIFYNKGDGNDIIYGGGDDDVLILQGFVEDDVLSFERTGETGRDLKLSFKDTAQGGFIILEDSFNNDARGIDRIVFDTNENGQDSTDIIWLDDASFEGHLLTFIDGGAPIATDDRIDVIEEYNLNPVTGAVLTDELGDDTYLIDYTQVSDIDPQVSGSDTIALQVNGVGGGYDTVLIQGYSGSILKPIFKSDNVILIELSEDTNIQFTFENDDIFERFVFDVDGDGLINGSDFTWLIGKFNINNLIKGTDVTDYIYGNTKDDEIYGGAGDDTIHGRWGNDEIYGDAGDDTIDGGWGDDTIYGGAGDDTIYGNLGIDTIFGGDGNDEIYGGDRNDIIDGGDGNDEIYGGAGNDRLYGGGGNDEIYGGDGVDEIRYNKGDGDDTIYGGDIQGNDNDDDVLILVRFVVEDILSFEQTGNDLKLIFEESAGGGSIILKDSINSDETGIDKIFFDTNNNGIEDTGEIVWNDNGFFVDYIVASNIPYTIIINGDAPIATVVDRIDVIAQYTVGTPLVLTNTPEDDTYLIDYTQVSGTDGIIELQVSEVVGESGFDTVIIKGYSGSILNPILKFDDVILELPEGELNPDIKFTFPNDNIFERFVFDTNNNNQIDGSDFTWLIGNQVIANNVEGTGVRDYIEGGAGDDIINGGAGADTIYGGAGDDTINGGTEIDYIEGGDGNDEIYGDAGDDNINGGAGIDRLFGGFGADTISGGDEDDTIEGGDGVDTIYGGLGDDTIYGGAGDDTIYGYDGDDTIYGDAGNDYISGDAGDDTIDGGGGIDEIYYEKGHGNDIIDGGAGDDDVLILGGFDPMMDILSFERTGDDLNDLKLTFKDTAQGVDGGSIILIDSFNNDEQGIDKIFFDANNDGIEDTTETIWEDEDFADHLQTFINGGAPIATAADRTVVSVTTGTVLINRLGVDDTYLINYIDGSGTIKLQVNDGVIGASGFDTVLVKGYSGVGFKPVFTISDMVFTDYDVITIIPRGGSKPNIEFTFANFDIFERFVFDTDNNDQIDNNDFTWLIGKQNVNNLIEGTGVRDYIHAWDGDDILYGYAGADTIDGGEGDDTIHGGDGIDIIEGGAGNDEISGGLGNDWIYGGDGNDEIYGGDGNDYIEGNDGIDTISGGAGDDTIYGDAGNDKITGGVGNDILTGGEGDDTIFGHNGVDTIDGGAGNDTIFGHEGDDIIDGGTGNNIFGYYEGHGNDTITAGDGEDVILVGFGVDDILSFVRTGDDLNDLKLTFKDSSQGVDGGSIILIDSFYDDARGIDRIVFDTNNDGIKDAEEIVWLDEDFESHLQTFIDGGAPIATAGIDVIEEYNKNIGTTLVLSNTLGVDDTYIIDYGKVTSGGEIQLQVNDGVIGASGYDTVLVQGYTGAGFRPEFTGYVIRINPAEGSKPNIEITFENIDIFERFVFDVDNSGLIDGNNFTWLIGKPNVNNLIEGTGVKDYIHTWNKDDIIYGYAGDDTIDGGNGNDEIYGGAGDDTIRGRDGNDTIDGGNGNDEIYGGAGDDTIRGRDGNDYIDGGGGVDTIIYYKGGGDDTIYGGAGVDVLILVGFVVDDILSFVRTGADLTLNFKDTSQGVDGGSIILKDSFNNDEQGIDRIFFDTDNDGIEDTTDIIWEDDASFASYIDGA